MDTGLEFSVEVTMKRKREREIGIKEQRMHKVKVQRLKADETGQ